ncbi:MAG: hypothetical protein FWF92_02550 [Oscillospiraceae bacterium]|nr:hypothetical protein [Oscillospiraceae bacterium]
MRIKKLLVLFLAVIIAGSFTACSKKGSGAAEEFIKLFSSGNFYIQLIVEEDGISQPVDVYLYNGMSAMYIKEDEAGTMRIIWRDGKTFLIFEDMKMYMVENYIEDEFNFDFAIEGETKYTKSGKAEFNGKNLSYDEYIDEDGIGMMIFTENGKLAGIRTLDKNGNPEEDTVILAFTGIEEGVAFTVFDFIPDDYELFS